MISERIGINCFHCRTHCLHMALWGANARFRLNMLRSSFAFFARLLLRKIRIRKAVPVQACSRDVVEGWDEFLSRVHPATPLESHG